MGGEMTRTLFLAPHNDDETLFGAFIVQQDQADVVVVLRSHYEATRWPDAHFHVREAETDAAMEILGRPWEQWTFSDLDPDWPEILRMFRERSDDYDVVYAPAVYTEGHPHHNAVGEAAYEAFGDRVLWYTTYSRTRGRETGTRVGPTAEQIVRKLRALACYRSQIAIGLMRPHFVGGLDEYVLTPTRSWTAAP
jgi:LmbE family N-acetylglucosaminyl deacetylase